MSLIMGQIESEHPELFALEFGKIAESDFNYTLASTNIDQSAANLVKMYMTIRSRMSSIMDLIGSELFELSALEFENLTYLTVYTEASANIYQSVPNLAIIYILIKSRMNSILEKLNQNILSYLPLTLEKLLKLTLFTLQHIQILTNQHQTQSKCM